MTMAAIAKGTSSLEGALFSDDTQHMYRALESLGFQVSADVPRSRMRVTGMGGQVPATQADIFCGNSGATIRFCTALSALGHGRYSFDGSERMRERPIGPLISALSTLGVFIAGSDRKGYPPVTVFAQQLLGGLVVFDRPVSSQFVSAILMAATSARSDVQILVKGPLISAPYVKMTTSVMSTFGAAVVEDYGADETRLIVPGMQPLQSRTFGIEPDATNASYFLAAPAVVGGRVTVEGLGRGSIQGDVGVVDVLERMGCDVTRSDGSLTVRRDPDAGRLRPVDVDLNAMPDVAQTIAVLALFADGPSTIRNVGNLRVKETDRLHAMALELSALGATVDEQDAALTIHPPKEIRPGTINTYEDHRMAMSFALAGLKCDGVVINDPDCVGKTFPDFFTRWTGMIEGRPPQ
jgi:3-phosphoshikimate 1-carboxyvinyltransferase